MPSETSAPQTTALQCISDPVVSLDADWRLTYVNDAAADLIGGAAADLEGRRVWDAWPDLQGTAAADRLREARDEGSATTVRLPATDGVFRSGRVYPDGERLTLLVTPADGEPTSPAHVDTADAAAVFDSGEDTEAVFDRISHGFFALDDDWRFTYANERTGELLGHSPDELEGEHIWELYPEARGTAFQEEYEAAMRTQQPVEFEAHYDPLDTWFRVNAYPSETGLSVYFTDITEPRRRERELERYETIVQAMNDGVYTVDEDGRFTMVNDEYARMTGYDREALLGDHVSKLVDEETIERAREIEADMAADERVSPTIRAEVERADGSTFPAEARFALIEGTTGLERIGVVRDITERRAQQRELERRVDQQTAVADLGRQALGGESLDDLFDSAVAAVAGVLDADYCKVLDLQPEAGELELRAGVGWQPGYVGEAAVGTGRDSQAGFTLVSEEPVVVEDFAEETRFAPPSLLTDHDVESGISVVIGPTDDPWGILGVHDTSPRSFAGTDTSFVESVANVLATAIDRVAYERRLKQYEVALERSTDVSAILDEDGTITYITPSVEEVFGYTPAEALGESIFEYLDQGEVEGVAQELEGLLADPSSQPTIEVTLRREDGSEAIVEASARNLTDEPHVDGILVNTREVTERRERERRLREQRDQLGALVDLNEVVREVNGAVIDATSRTELEERVCETLAGADSYAFAWVGEVDTTAGEVVPRTSAGPHQAYLDAVSIPYGEDTEPTGPGATALETGRTQVVRDIDGLADEAWQVAARDAGFRAMAAIPLRYDGRQYGLLALYSRREAAFDDRERTVVSHLGESIGHAIAALEHREALMAESAIELELSIPSDDLPVDESGDTTPRIQVERTIPLDDGRFLVYASADGTTESAVRTFIEQGADTVARFRHVGEHDGVGLYEWLLDEPPTLSMLGERGGQVREIAIQPSSAIVTVELPPESDVRAVVDAVAEQYPDTSLVSQQQVTLESKSSIEYVGEVESKLTERQRQTLETAYVSGYYEWPRRTDASELADALSIGDATVSQHLRAGHRKLCGTLFEREEREDRSDGSE